MPTRSNQPPAPAAPRTPSGPSSSGSLKDWCCFLFVLLLFLTLLPLIGVLSIILVAPLKPHFDIMSVEVQYMNIAADNPTGTTASITLTIRLVFQADNPNKLEMKYGESRFTIMYGDIPLGNASIPGFFQEGHSSKQVVATIFVDSMRLLQGDATDLIRDASLNDRVSLRVLGDVEAKTRVKKLYSLGVKVSVDCAIVISPRKQSVTFKQCGLKDSMA